MSILNIVTESAVNNNTISPIQASNVALEGKHLITNKTTLNNAIMSVLKEPLTTNMEINTLRQVANNNVSMKLIARDVVNRLLPIVRNKYVLAEGTYRLRYKDERGAIQFKTEAYNDALWIMAIQTSLEVGHTNHSLLGKIIADWATRELEGIVIDKKSSEDYAIKYIKVMIDLGLIESNPTDLEYFKPNGELATTKVWKVTESTLEDANTIKDEIVERTHYACQPLRNEPAPWESMNSGIGSNANMRLVPKYLGKADYVANDVISAVNKLQSVAYRIDKSMAEYATRMVTADISEEDLRVYKEASRLHKGIVYNPMTLDQRGRMYARGGVVTPQGTDFCKALYQLAEPKMLGERGYEAIAIHLANTLGYGGKSLNDRKRIVWKEYKEGRFNLNTPEEVLEQYKSSDECQAFVAMKEFVRISEILKGFRKGSKRVQFIKSSLVCHQDGTCNGLQHIAAITKDLQTAKAVNLTASTADDAPSDIYGLVSDAALPMVTSEFNINLLKEYGRGLTKYSVMVKGYGAGETTVKAQVAKACSKHDIEISKENLEELSTAIAKGINVVCPAINKFTEALKAEVNIAMTMGLQKVSWKTADEFRVITQYVENEHNVVRAGNFNATLKGQRFLNMVKTANALSPNFIHSIDANHLRNVVNEANWEVVSVHDSIGTHAATYFETSRIIREQFIKVHSFDWLDSLADCLSPEVDENDVNDFKKVLTFEGQYDINEVNKSSYIFS